MSSRTETDYKAEIDRHFAWFEAKLPAGPARFMSWLRKPTSKLVRLPLGILLILGGIFSILPLLGLWMLPLGLILIAQDIPRLEKPVARFLGWMERKWMARQRAKAASGLTIADLHSGKGTAKVAGERAGNVVRKIDSGV